MVGGLTMRTNEDYSPNFSAMSGLLQFLTEHCCEGDAACGG